MVSRNTRVIFTCRLDRKVSFADSLGLELASIRLMSEGRDTPPNLSNVPQPIEFNATKPSNTKILEPQFKQPITDFNAFYHSLGINSVALESICIIENTINGIVKVRNIAFEKEVIVCYTYDDWMSVNHCRCHYINPTTCDSPSTTSIFDTFVFQLPADANWHTVEFCIQYKCSGQTYWDNNRGENYCLKKSTTPD